MIIDESITCKNYSYRYQFKKIVREILREEHLLDRRIKFKEYQIKALVSF